MASLHEYFLRDYSHSFTIQKEIGIGDVSGVLLGSFIGRLHWSMDANAFYVSFYIPHMEKIACPSRIVLNSLDSVLSLKAEISVEGGFPSQEMVSSDEAIFTGRVYIYSEDDIASTDRQAIEQDSKKAGHFVTVRSKSYAEMRSKLEHPLAFISHDSRDKAEIAEPLALQLQKMLCPVWYDEFSLKIGDNLRESIEHGIRQCRKCILVLTPNFLKNGGWPKREYDAAFSKEIIGRQNIILPIWHGVQATEIYEYSQSLYNKKAIDWSRGVEEVARRLVGSINAI